MFMLVAVDISSVLQEQFAHVHLPLVGCVHKWTHPILRRRARKKKNSTRLFYAIALTFVTWQQIIVKQLALTGRQTIATSRRTTSSAPANKVLLSNTYVTKTKVETKRASFHSGILNGLKGCNFCPFTSSKQLTLTSLQPSSLDASCTFPKRKKQKQKTKCEYNISVNTNTPTCRDFKTLTHHKCGKHTWTSVILMHTNLAFPFLVPTISEMESNRRTNNRKVSTFHFWERKQKNKNKTWISRGGDYWQQR